MSGHGWASIFDAEARLEYVRASEYYRAISPKLGQSFVTAFESTLSDIADFPEANPIFHPPDIRRKFIRRFPYYIVYIIEPDAIFIVAVAHERRDPDYWLHRLNEPGR